MEYPINWFEEIESTNNEAFKQYEIADNFAVFAARFQTKGRGQRGAGWESAPGMNLTFSVLMKRSNLTPSKQFVISQIVAIGVKRYLQTLGIEASIKWPNDIYVEDKKICGILIEHRIMGDTLSGSIAGIGVNINQEVFLSDAPNPVSVYNIIGRKLDIEEELKSLTDIIYLLYKAVSDSVVSAFSNNTASDSIVVTDDRILSGDGVTSDVVAALELEYHNSLYHLQEYHLYQEMPGGEIFEARITGIDQSACLLLERRDGTVRRYHFKEVKYLRRVL